MAKILCCSVSSNVIAGVGEKGVSFLLTRRSVFLSSWENGWCGGEELVFCCGLSV